MCSESVGWNYLSILKLQRLYRWSLGIDKYFYPTQSNGRNYFSMLGFKSTQINHNDYYNHKYHHRYGAASALGTTFEIDIK